MIREIARRTGRVNHGLLHEELDAIGLERYSVRYLSAADATIVTVDEAITDVLKAQVVTALTAHKPADETDIQKEGKARLQRLAFARANLATLTPAQRDQLLLDLINMVLP